MTDHLPNWRDGSTKQSVLDFIERANSRGSDHMERVDRIATFDNDGALWVEKPAPPQFDFLFRAWTEAVEKDPALANEQP